MDALSFLVAGEYFAVDVTLVRTVVRKLEVTPVPTTPDEVLGIANMKGRVVTILCLYTFFDRRAKQREDKVINTVNAVIFKALTGDADQIGMVIDKPDDLIKINDKDIRPFAGTTGTKEDLFISGIAEKNGRLYRIMDISYIHNEYNRA